MKFKPIGKIDNLKHGLRCLEELNEEFDDKKYDMDSLVKEIDNRGEEYVKILDYVSQYYGKYVKIKFYYNINYGTTREDDPQWVCDYEANVFLYRYNPLNHRLFGVFNKMNDDYSGGVNDSSIDLFDKMKEHMFEIEGITKEEFIETSIASVSRCLEHRIEKNNSGSYQLTKNGYTHVAELYEDIY